MTFVELFTNKVSKTFKNVFSVLFLFWYTYNSIASNPIALLHDLGRLHPQHKFIVLILYSNIISKWVLKDPYEVFVRILIEID